MLGVGGVFMRIARGWFFGRVSPPPARVRGPLRGGPPTPPARQGAPAPLQASVQRRAKDGAALVPSLSGSLPGCKAAYTAASLSGAGRVAASK